MSHNPRTSPLKTLPTVEHELPEWAKKKKTSTKNDPREVMRRKTPAEINTKKVDGSNRLILSATRRVKSAPDGLAGEGGDGGGGAAAAAAESLPRKPGRDPTFRNMEAVISPEYKHTRRSPDRPLRKAFPEDVLQREAEVGGPEPRYGRERMFETHRALHQQTIKEVEADTAAAAAAAAASRKSQQVLAVGPAPDHLFSPEFLKLDMSQLPLSAYDSPELFDRQSPEEWIESSGGRGLSPFMRGSSGPREWLPCDVLGYDAASDQFSIRFDHNGFAKKVHRLRLTFDGEDRAMFDRRVAFCEERQQADVRNRRHRRRRRRLVNLPRLCDRSWRQSCCVTCLWGLLA
jgi:hypothetical protein